MTAEDAPPGRSIRETFLAACRALDEAGTPYVVVGGFAVSAWGTPRTTEDVDVILDVEVDEVGDVVQGFSDHGLSLQEADLRDAIREGSHATVFDERSPIYHVDLRPATDADTRRTLDDRRQVTIAGRTVPVASPEETIAHKLLYGSEQDLRDAEGVYARQGSSLDRERLASRCEDLGVLQDLRDLEERAGGSRDETGGPPTSHPLLNERRTVPPIRARSATSDHPRPPRETTPRGTPNP